MSCGACDGRLGFGVFLEVDETGDGTGGGTGCAGGEEWPLTPFLSSFEDCFFFLAIFAQRTNSWRGEFGADLGALSSSGRASFLEVGRNAIGFAHAARSNTNTRGSYGPYNVT